MGMRDHIARIRAAGFSLAADGDKLLVSPVELLSALQRQWLREHRSAILTAIHATEPANAAHHLPSRLVSAAIRVCRELHGDGEDGIRAMLDDLAAHPPEDWDALKSEPPREFRRLSGLSHATRADSSSCR